MEYGEKILKRIKSAIGRKFHKLVSIEKFDELNHKVTYIELDYNYINKPQFSIMHAFFDFKVELRDSRIDFLLTNKEENDEETFDVENIIYSDEQRKIIEKLRQTNSQYKSAHDILEEVKIEYSKSFNVGDTVYYNNLHGIITFKHNYKKGNQQLWSVKTGDTEHRYVMGTLILKRNVKDLSNIPIDPELNKLSTEKLLKMYKRSLARNKGIGDRKIKRILNEREHVQKGVTKIITNVH